MIVGLYLVTPMLRVYTQGTTHANLVYTLIICGVGSIGAPLLQHWGIHSMLFGMWPVTGYIFFYLLGYALSDVVLPAWSYWWLSAGFGFGGVLTAQLTEIATMQTGGKLDDTWYGNLTPNLALMSICLFLCLKDLPYDRWISRSPRLESVIKTISLTSFSVYLIHPLLIEICQDGRLGFRLNALPISPMITIPVFTGLILGASMLVILALRRLPGGCMIAT